MIRPFWKIGWVREPTAESNHLPGFTMPIPPELEMCIRDSALHTVNLLINNLRLTYLELIALAAHGLDEMCIRDRVYEMVFDLMCDLDATEDQLDFPVFYGSAKNGWMGEDYNHPTDNIEDVYKRQG